MPAGAETTKVGQGTGRRPGIRAFAGVTPGSRYPLLRNQNAYQLVHEGKEFIIRTEAFGAAGKAFKAAGVALPPVL
jgi:hypothetical protein